MTPQQTDELAQINTLFKREGQPEIVEVIWHDNHIEYRLLGGTVFLGGKRTWDDYLKMARLSTK